MCALVQWKAVLQEAESRIEREVAKAQQSYYETIDDSLKQAVKAAAVAETTQTRVLQLTDQLQTQLKSAKSLESDVKKATEAFQDASNKQFNVTPDSVAKVLLPLLADSLNLKSSVVAFALSECPEGWLPYKPAFGRFVRGIDLEDPSIDPDGLRSRTGRYFALLNRLP